MADFWDKHEELKMIEKNKKEVIKIFACLKQDRKYVEFRTFTRASEEDTDYKPTKKGIVIPREHWDTIVESIG